jgi:ArsR family transcriptional regulator
MEHELAIFGACADATRLRLLQLLAQRELCVCEMVELLGMPQGKVSRHLGVLRRAGLVRCRREGTWMHYALNKQETPLGRLVEEYLHRPSQDPTLAQDRRQLRRLGADLCLKAGKP